MLIQQIVQASKIIWNQKNSNQHDQEHKRMYIEISKTLTCKTKHPKP
jgi:hypothetical protein